MHNKIDIDMSGLITGVIQIFRDLQVIGINKVEARQIHRIPKVDADGKTQVDEIEFELIIERK